jgi:crotonobetainyl-CoA:carnitine CoA-transferase CaiB-like acyl-CoA transferase
MLGNDDRDWVDLCEHIERLDLISDIRFKTAADRAANTADAVKILDEIFAGKTLDEWRELLQTARGVWSWVQTPEEVFNDPQTLANGFLREAKYPNGGSLRLPAPPILFDEEAGEPPRAPDFAEHTDEVLGEIGIGSEAIAELRTAGVIK